MSGPAFLRKYNTLTVTGSTAIRIPIIKRGVVDFAVGADWTPAAGDVKINIDGAGPANVTNLPTAVASGNTAYWEFILTAAELTCKQAIITIADASTKVIEDQCFLVETFGHASAMYPADYSAAAVTLPTIPTDWITANGIAADAFGSSEVAGGAASEIASAVRTELTTELGRIDAAVSTRATPAQVNTEADTALSDAGVTPTRTGYLDKLNITGNVAGSAEVTSIQNNTRVRLVVPDVIERPDSGTQTYKIHLYIYDEIGNMEAPDSAPTLTLVNQSGTDLSARLNSATGTLAATGHYTWTYTASVGDTLEQLLWEFTVVEGGATRVHGTDSVIVDTTAVDFTSADRTKLNAIETRLPSDPADASDLAGLLSALTSHGDSEWATATGFSTLSAADVREAIGIASANLDTQLGALATSTALASLVTTVGAAGAGLTALPWNAAWDAEVQSECADALAALSIDGKTLVQALQIIAAMVAGKASGAGTNTEVFKGLDGSTTRVTVTADTSGNRSAVAYNG